MAVQFTFDQAVRTMGVTPERLEKLIDEGKIRAHRGVVTTFDREAVLEYMNKVGHEAVLERIERAKPASQRAKKYRPSTRWRSNDASAAVGCCVWRR